MLRDSFQRGTSLATTCDRGLHTGTVNIPQDTTFPRRYIRYNFKRFHSPHVASFGGGGGEGVDGTGMNSRSWRPSERRSWPARGR